MSIQEHGKVVGQLIGLGLMVVFVVVAFAFDLQPRGWPPIIRFSILVAAVIITSLSTWYVVRRRN